MSRGTQNPQNHAKKFRHVDILSLCGRESGSEGVFGVSELQTIFPPNIPMRGRVSSSESQKVPKSQLLRKSSVDSPDLTIPTPPRAQENVRKKIIKN